MIQRRKYQNSFGRFGRSGRRGWSADAPADSAREPRPPPEEGLVRTGQSRGQPATRPRPPGHPALQAAPPTGAIEGAGAGRPRGFGGRASPRGTLQTHLRVKSIVTATTATSLQCQLLLLLSLLLNCHH